MSIVLEKIKSLATMYLFWIIVGVSLFSIFIDHKSLVKKKLKKEAKICKFIGFAYLIGGVAFFVVMNYIL